MTTVRANLTLLTRIPTLLRRQTMFESKIRTVEKSRSLYLLNDQRRRKDIEDIKDIKDIKDIEVHESDAQNR